MPRAHPSAQTGYLHEMRDQVGAMRGVAGHAVRVMGHDELAAELAAAFIAFRTGRPGARYVEIPLDLLAETARGRAARAPAHRAAAAGARRDRAPRSSGCATRSGRRSSPAAARRARPTRCGRSPSGSGRRCSRP